ncbi:MAG: hypothetical protein ACE5FK_01850 [Candidatus Methylomirabilia bacterium]
MRRASAVCLSVLIGFTGCASYTPSSAPIPKAEAMPVWTTEGTVALGADPYVQPDRQTAVFDADLNGAGVLPIQVLLRNEGTRQRLIRPSNMSLVLPVGSEISSAGASAVAAKLESTGGVVGASIAFGLIGFLVASSAEDKARAARLADYRGKELQDVTLKKDESAHGFVYFIPPPGTPAFDDATLTVRFVDVEEATSFVVRLRLSGLGFKETPAKAEEEATSTDEPTY